MLTLILVVAIGLVAHIVTTILVGRWLARVAREEIAQGLRQLVAQLPAPLRSMIDLPPLTDNTREKVNA